MYKYNLAGWFDGIEEGAVRSTLIPVPEGNWEKVVGQDYPQFMGNRWEVIPYNGFEGLPIDPLPEPEPEPEPIQPEIVVTSLEVDPDHVENSIIEDDLSSVTLPLGATLIVTAELRADDQVVPISETFRMPLVSVDGRHRVLLVKFVDGVATFSAKMTDSRIYHVKEEHVNQELPPERHMKFKGFKVYAYE